MKKIAGICILAASGLATYLGPAQAASPDAAAGIRKFRYMDMAQVRRSTGLHNAVLVVGPAKKPAKAAEQAVPRSPVYRNHAGQAGGRVIMRPMT